MAKKKQELKICIRCNKHPKYGKTTSYCRSCANADMKRRYRDDSTGVAASQKAYYEKNKEDFNQRSRDWYERHPTYGSEYYRANKAKIDANHRAWRAAHPNYGSEAYHRRKAKLAALEQGQ